MTIKQLQPTAQILVPPVLVNHSQIPLKLMLSVSCGMFLLTMQPNVQAETLKDPTQPPASFSSEIIYGVTAASGPILQSVMLGKQFSAAIINGQKVLLGKKYEQATLISVNENQAVLRNPDRTTLILKMDYADMKKVVLPKQTTKNKTHKPANAD